MTSPTAYIDRASQWASRTRSGFARFLLAAVAICGLSEPSPGYAADNARVRQIAAELNIPRRAWTICTVDEIGRAVQPGQTADATADRALARCADRQQALRAKAVELLGAEAAGRLMERLVAEAREALVGSARTLEAARASGGRVDPAWPRLLGPTR